MVAEAPGCTRQRRDRMPRKEMDSGRFFSLLNESHEITAETMEISSKEQLLDMYLILPRLEYSD